MDDIAAHAGVSRATVSFVLGGRSTNIRIAEKTRRRVLDAAAGLGYRPNTMAKAVASGKSRVIGLVIYGMHTPNVQEMENSVLKEVSAQGYTTKLFQLPNPTSEDYIAQIIEECLSYRIEGVMAITLDEKDMVIIQKQADQKSLPIAFVGGIPPQKSLGVYAAPHFGVSLGIEHLVGLGHRRIAYLSGPSGSCITRLQIESFQTVMAEFQLPITEKNVAHGDWDDRNKITAAFEQLMNTPEPPTAIFCNSAIQAMVVLVAARRRGLKLPEQLSVVAYGQDQFVNYTDPALTTIVQPTGQMGTLATQLLLTELLAPANDCTRQPLCVTEGIHLTVRDSTRPPKSV